LSVLQKTNKRIIYTFIIILEIVNVIILNLIRNGICTKYVDIFVQTLGLYRKKKNLTFKFWPLGALERPPGV